MVGKYELEEVGNKKKVGEEEGRVQQWEAKDECEELERGPRRVRGRRKTI